ncbi:dihydroorotate dehydrogenase B catalytic subunit [bacterium E08(2017)]|nr:dihydroorotate dehydrogenase B catalytic subunit [bacterium E08(2017)]
MNLSVDIGGIKMKNPVTTASGTFGYGPEYADFIDVNRLGAIVVKGISLYPWDGNQTPRMAEVPGGLVNAIGLQNPGIEGFEKKYMPFLREQDVPVIVNLWGRSVDEYADGAAQVSEIEGIAGIEVNISCPNIKEGGIAFGTDEKMAAEVISAVRKKTDLPMIPKLSPNVTDIGVFAKVAEEEGADAISLINTLPGMVIDIETRKPVLANVVGGLSGPAIHPVAVRMVWQASNAVSIPIIGMGGITDADTALEFIIAGASAVAVGTATFSDPASSIRVLEGIEAYLKANDIDDVRDLVGTLEV